MLHSVRFWAPFIDFKGVAVDFEALWKLEIFEITSRKYLCLLFGRLKSNA